MCLIERRLPRLTAYNARHTHLIVNLLWQYTRCDTSSLVTSAAKKVRNLRRDENSLRFNSARSDFDFKQA